MGEKMFCKNCKWFVDVSETPFGGIYCRIFFPIDNPDYRGLNKGINNDIKTSNINGNCKYYKRKWWKWWV